MYKRGLTQIDWVMSIAIFMVFIALLFLFVRPNYSQQNLLPIINVIEKNFENDVSLTVNKIPYFSKNNFSQNEPVVLVFSNEADENKVSLPDNRSLVIINDKIFFYGNDKEYIITSNQNYAKKNETFDLVANAGSTIIPSKNFEVGFNGGLINNITYYGKLKAFNFRYPFSGGDSFLNKSFLAIYLAADHESYVFGNFSRIFNFNADEFNLDVELFTYSNVYHDGNNISIDYGTVGCTAFSTTFIDFFNLTDPNGIVFEGDNLTGVYCWNNTPALNLSFTTDKYNINLHNGDFRHGIDTRAEFSLGIAETKTGFYLPLANFSYEQKKSEWNIADMYNFKITIANESSVFYTLGQDIKSTNVHAKTTNKYIIDKFGNFLKVKVNYLVG